MEYQILKKRLWNVDLIRFSPWKSAVEKTTLRIHSWILITENHLIIRKKINLEHKSLIYQRKNLTNIPSKQFYISWCFYFLDMWHFRPNGSCSQKVRFLKVCRTVRQRNSDENYVAVRICERRSSFGLEEFWWRLLLKKNATSRIFEWRKW